MGSYKLIKGQVMNHNAELMNIIPSVPLNALRRKVYVIGSLRGDTPRHTAWCLRESFPEWEIFDDWHSAGPEADDIWKTYEQERGRTYIEALAGKAATNVFKFDRSNIDSSDDVVLTLPSGKSGHLELGYAAGMGKRTFILLEANVDPRWDVMYKFADHVVENYEQLEEKLNGT